MSAWSLRCCAFEKALNGNFSFLLAVLVIGMHYAGGIGNSEKGRNLTMFLHNRKAFFPGKERNITTNMLYSQ